MCLYLSAKLTLNDNVGLCKTLCGIAANVSCRSTDIAIERQARRRGKSRDMAFWSRSAVVNRRGRWLARFVHIDDKRQRFVVDANEA